MQCENPPCVHACPVKATWTEEDGIIVIDYDWCIGCRYCMTACPYWARHFNWNEPQLPTEELNPDTHYLGNRPRSRGVTEKCTFCVQRIRRAERQIEGQKGEELTDQKIKDGNFSPACVNACPTDTLVFGDLNDETSEVVRKSQSERSYRLFAELGTEPSVFYLKKVDRAAKAH